MPLSAWARIIWAKRSVFFAVFGVINGLQAVLPRMTDFRDLSRPIRRRSHYPTLLALLNSLKKLQEAGVETNALAEYLLEQMQDIREHAKRERVNRL